MADREVMLDFGLEEVLKSLSEFGIFRALKWEQKGVIATLVTGKHHSAGRVANWFWEKSDISGTSSCKRNNDGDTFERSCRFSTSEYCV